MTLDIDPELFGTARKIVAPDCAHRMRNLLLQAGRIQPRNPETADQWRVLLGAGKAITAIMEATIPILHGTDEPSDAEKRRAIMNTSIIMAWLTDFRDLCARVQTEEREARAKAAAEPIPDLATYPI